MSTPERGSYSVREAAKILGVSSWLIREQCRRGTLHHVRMGGRILIPRWVLDKLVGKPTRD